MAGKPLRSPSPKRKYWFAAAAGVALLLLCALRPPLLEVYSFSRRVSDRRGDLLRLTLSKDEKYRVFTPLSGFSDAFKQAVLLKEDRYFYSHPGINPFAVLRAGFSTYLSRARWVGASTISMQLARLRFGLRTRSIPSKLWQMIRAMQLELHYSKDEIFEAYLNLAPYGYNIEGAGAASLVFFHKDARELTLPESLALAVLPQNPARRRLSSGVSDSSAFGESRRHLYEDWVRQHPEDEPLRALMSLPVATYGRKDLPFNAPHVSEFLLRQHPTMQHIESTLDSRLQQTVEIMLLRGVLGMKRLGVRNAAALLVDVSSMEVLASVGSVNFFDATIHGQIDGTRMKRSPGSAMKPFLYALAFDQGLVHPLSMMADTPMSFGSYDPENFDRKFLGAVSVKDALRMSRNVPALRLAAQLKSPSLYEFLQSAGISRLQPENTYGLSLVLGGAEVSPRELVSLYAALGNGGVQRELLYSRSAGKSEKAEKKLFSPEASFLTLDAMRTTARPEIRVGGPEVYWKTGTSNGFHDAWTAGLFGKYALVVWIGDFTGASNPSYVGIQTAAPLFFSIIHALPLWEGEDVAESLRRRAKVEAVEVCAPTGEIYDPLCPAKTTAWFIPGVSPIARQHVFRRVLVDVNTGLRTCRYEEGKTEWRVLEFWPSDLRAAFEASGIHKVSLPAMDPECEDTGADGGSAPKITSPHFGVEYQQRLDAPESEQIPLLAVVDADVKTTHWYAGRKYLGKSSPQAPLFWKADPGTHIIRAVDDHGRADSVRIQVGLAR